MRVLYFSQDYTTHDRRFLSGLAESRHQVFFLRLENRGASYEQRSLDPGVHPVEWLGGKGPAGDVAAWLHLMPDFESVLQRISPDLVHAGPVQSCGFMTALAQFHPFLVMSWGSDILLEADRDPAGNWMTRYTLDRSDALLCDCRAVREKVHQLVDYSHRPVVQIPWGTDLPVFAPGPDSLGLRRQLGWEDAFVIISTRSWEPVYGIDVLIQGFRQAHECNGNLRLMLLGDGSLASAVQLAVAEYGLEHAVYRPGRIPQDRLPDYFRSANLYVSTAYSDGSSVSLLEAMACALPALVTDAPGNREWVEPGENGWLSAAGNWDELAQLLLQASGTDPARLATMGRLNRKVAEERADWPANFGRLLHLYDQLERQYAR